MKRGPTGTYEVTAAGGETVRAFIPRPLPPEPPLALQGPMQPHLERALLALGRLDRVSTLLPETDLFLYAYVRKEAVLSSQIEGTQSSLSDLLMFEMEQAPGASLDDVVEVSNYVSALEHGLGRLRGGFPLSARLVREIHAKLLARGRGSRKEPGEFRRSQNWIGGIPRAEVEPIRVPSTNKGTSLVPHMHELLQESICIMENLSDDSQTLRRQRSANGGQTAKPGSDHCENASPQGIQDRQDQGVSQYDAMLLPVLGIPVQFQDLSKRRHWHRGYPPQAKQEDDNRQ